MMGNRPVVVLQEGTERSRGQDAQENNIMAARAIADAVRSTLGPKGMDKMLVDGMGDVVITNDGATILKELDIEHPAAKMVIEVSESQDDECGDGTTTAVVLAGELLKSAEDLIDDVHATLLTQGYQLAEEKAIEILDDLAIETDIKDEESLVKVASTAMASKSAASHSDLLGRIAVDAARSVAEDRDGQWVVDTDNVQIVQKQGGSISDTDLVDGILLDKDRVHSGMPAEIEDARIALIDTALEVQQTEVDAEIQITDPSQLQDFLDEEQASLENMVQTIKDAGANVVFCQKGIDDMAQHYLAKNGIYAIRRVKKSDMQKLEKATGGKIVSNVDDLEESDLGEADNVEERKVAGDELTFVTGCKDPKAVSVLVRGGTEHVIDEVVRTLEDALGVVAVAIEDGKVVPGGGAPEVEVADKLREYATSVGGREQLAIEAFADSVEIIPRTLAENAGLDSIDALVALRNAHESGETGYGLDLQSGDASDMAAANVLEPLRVKTQAVKSATEVATMILRIDDVIAAKGFSDDDDEGPDLPGGGGPPAGGGMPGGMGGMM